MDGTQRRRFQEALLAALPRRFDLEQLLLFDFNKRLQDIPAGETYAELVLNTIGWAETNDKLDELALQALKSVPGNPVLKAYVAEFLAPSPPPKPPPVVVQQLVDLPQLIKILSGQPQVTNAAARYNFVRQLLAASPGANALIGGINLEGNPMTAASAIIFGLMGPDDAPLDYAPGRYYILDALNQLIELVAGESNKEFLRQTAQAIAANAGISASASLPTVARSIPSNSWTGQEDTPSAEAPNAEAMFNEKVIDENTLRPIFYLSLGLTAAEAVCKISRPRRPGSALTMVGTGFLVTPRHILTNNHVIGGKEILAETTVRFRFERLPDGAEREVLLARPRPGTEIITDKELDFTLFELDPDDALRIQQAGITPLTLSQAPVEINNRVAIIQHPGGEYKQISLQNNRVQGVGDTFLDYTTTTLPGSSGSPVLDDYFRVVGIHRAGGDLKKPGGNLFYYQNRGTMITAIIPLLLQNGIKDLTITEGSPA